MYFTHASSLSRIWDTRGPGSVGQQHAVPYDRTWGRHNFRRDQKSVCSRHLFRDLVPGLRHLRVLGLDHYLCHDRNGCDITGYSFCLLETRKGWYSPPYKWFNFYSISGFHTSQTLPTRSGPGLRVSFPGSQPAGVASFPPDARTCWNA